MFYSKLEVQVTQENGLHLIDCTMLVDELHESGVSEIRLVKNETKASVDGLSILGVVSLMVEEGDLLTVLIHAKDKDVIKKAFESFINRGVISSIKTEKIKPY